MGERELKVALKSIKALLGDIAACFFSENYVAFRLLLDLLRLLFYTCLFGVRLFCSSISSFLRRRVLS